MFWNVERTKACVLKTTSEPKPTIMYHTHTFGGNGHMYVVHSGGFGICVPQGIENITLVNG